MDDNGDVMSNNPYNPKFDNPNPFFNKEWRNHNPWMEGIEDDPITELRNNLDKIKKDSEPKDTKRIGICINFVEGIPLDSFIERENEKVAIIKKKLDDLTVFKNMMSESKGISRVVRNYDK